MTKTPFPWIAPFILWTHIPHAQAFEGFLSSHGFSTDTEFELKPGVGSDGTTQLGGHGWHLWPGGAVDILPWLGSHWGKCRKMMCCSLSHQNGTFHVFSLVTRFRLQFHYISNGCNGSKRKCFRDGICCHLHPSEV